MSERDQLVKALEDAERAHGDAGSRAGAEARRKELKRKGFAAHVVREMIVDELVELIQIERGARRTLEMHDALTERAPHA